MKGVPLPSAGQKRTCHYSDTDQLEAGEYHKLLKSKTAEASQKADAGSPSPEFLLRDQSYQDEVATPGILS